MWFAFHIAGVVIILSVLVGLALGLRWTLRKAGASAWLLKLSSGLSSALTLTTAVMLIVRLAEQPLECVGVCMLVKLGTMSWWVAWLFYDCSC